MLEGAHVRKYEISAGKSVGDGGRGSATGAVGIHGRDLITVNVQPNHIAAIIGNDIFKFRMWRHDGKHQSL